MEMRIRSKISRIARKFCDDCRKDMKCGTDPKTGRPLHGCEECWVYWIMNEMAGCDTN